MSRINYQASALGLDRDGPPAARREPADARRDDGDRAPDRLEDRARSRSASCRSSTTRSASTERASCRGSSRVQSLEWQSLSIVNEAMSMLRVIVSFGREGYEHRRFREQGQTAVDARVEAHRPPDRVHALGADGHGARHGPRLLLRLPRGLQRRASRSASSSCCCRTSPRSTARWRRSATRSASLNEQLVRSKASFELLDLEPEVKEDPQPIELERARRRGRVRGRRVRLSGPRGHAQRHLVPRRARQARGSRSSGRPARARRRS